MILSRRKKPGRKKAKARWWHWPWFYSTWSKVLLTLGIFAFVAVSFVLIDTYNQFSRQIDRKISGEIFLNTAKVYAAPLEVYPGQPIGPSQIRDYLDAAGYAPHDQEDPSLGRYTASGEGLEIFPGDQAYGGSATPVRIEFDEDGIESIVSLSDQSLLEFYDLEPRLITHLFDKSREKRRLIEYWEIPQVLRDAVLAIEDRRFFSHYGFDPIALIGVALGGFERGASTITQQLVRSSSFWLTRERRVIRKAKEIYMSTILETRLSKEQIFTLYSNDIYLGQSGSFSINGFGEAATAYFNKDIKDLTLPEAALLAGLIQSPNRYSPTRRPERALRRRNVVLMAMLETGSITSEQYQVAVKAPLEVAPHSVDQNDAPYFVDMLKDRLLQTYSDEELLTKRFKVYTTLDSDLQAIAYQVVRDGADLADQNRAHRKRRGPKARWDPSSSPRYEIAPEDRVQVCLIALDAITGEIRALVGGRDYGSSQLNRVTYAKRQPGSIFKPFVFAAAINSAMEQTEPLVTASTMVEDVKTVFNFNEEPYEPNNYGEKFYGPVTLRRALTKSLNVATIKFAEMIGWQKVVDLAISAGMNDRILATPAAALGSYEVTPLEIAEAFTIFANQGIRVEPRIIRDVANGDGKVIFSSEISSTEVLDPRVAYLMTNLMEGVINRGTGIRARFLGLRRPAAGKTGTSHDGWFAGYTSGLLCIIWVGFDDNRELMLEGASSALPIWTEFMKQAVKLQPWLAEDAFEQPEEGMVRVHIDEETGLLATPDCQSVIYEHYIAGSEPTQRCGHSAHEWLYDQRQLSNQAGATRDEAEQPAQPPSKKTNRFKRIFSKIF